MARKKGYQKGAQQHAEGQHGHKTHTAFLEGRHGRHGGSPESEGAPQGGADDRVPGEPIRGHHRLAQDREQHDEGEKNSENSEKKSRARLGR